MPDALEVVPAGIARSQLRVVQERALAPVRAALELASAASTSRNAGSYGMPLKTCTATNALSRPWAGESSASSPAVKRSSIGKLTAWRSRAARAARTAATACSRGTLYSISSKRTSRSEAKLPSTSPRARAARRPPTRTGSAADRAREALGDLVERAEGVVVHHDVLDVGARSARLVRRVVGAVERAGERDVGVRERPELEVVVRVGARLQILEHRLERFGPVDVAQAEGRAHSGP